MSAEGGERLAVFALGGNLGDPLESIRSAVVRLAEVLRDPRVSAVYRTPPEGGAPQPAYLNAAVAGHTRMTAREALAFARSLEAAAGRERPYSGAPRTLDVDVVFLGEDVVDEPDLRVPHPRWARRDFVVVPLLDVAPDFVDPRTGWSVRDVAAAAGWSGHLLPRVLEPGAILSAEVS